MYPKGWFGLEQLDSIYGQEGESFYMDNAGILEELKEKLLQPKTRYTLHKPDPTSD